MAPHGHARSGFHVEAFLASRFAPGGRPATTREVMLVSTPHLTYRAVSRLVLGSRLLTRAPTCKC